MYYDQTGRPLYGFMYVSPCYEISADKIKILVGLNMNVECKVLVYPEVFAVGNLWFPDTN